MTKNFMTKLKRSVQFSLENILEFKKSSTVENAQKLGKISLLTFYPQLSKENLLCQEFTCIGRGPSENRHLMCTVEPTTLNPTDRFCLYTHIARGGHGLALV